MNKSENSTLVWTKDSEGTRHLCPFNSLSNPNSVSQSEMTDCVDDDTMLKSRNTVPSNTPEGKIRFAKSVSLN